MSNHHHHNDIDDNDYDGVYNENCYQTTNEIWYIFIISVCSIKLNLVILFIRIRINTLRYLSDMKLISSLDKWITNFFPVFFSRWIQSNSITFHIWCNKMENIPNLQHPIDKEYSTLMRVREKNRRKKRDYFHFFLLSYFSRRWFFFFQ